MYSCSTNQDNMDVYMYGFQVLFLFVSKCTGFISVCPHVSHAKIKEKSCKQETPMFMCFRDINKNVFKEMCRKTEQYQSDSLKIVVSGNLDGVPCDDKHFQPFTYSSSHGDTCVFLKSFCNEVGQIVSDNGLTKSDRTCRCDYRFGYSFVSRPSGTCFCEPSKEDCSCYYKKCEKDQVLSPDYHCIDRDNITVNFRCPWISESNSKKSTETKNFIKRTHEESSCSCPQHTLKDTMRTQPVVIIIGIPLDLPKLKVNTEEPCTEIGIANPPLIEAEWKKYEHGLYTAMGGNVSLKNKDTTIFTLMLNRVTQWHAGTYLCTAQNAIGKAQSLPLTLHISEVPVEKSSIKSVCRTPNQIRLCGLYQRSFSLPIAYLT